MPNKNLLALLLLALGLSGSAQAQTPFAQCGEIVNAPGFCFWFRSNGVDYDIGPAQAQVFPGQIRFITGTLMPNCQNLCFVTNCILNAQVSNCVTTTPFSDCGTLVQGATCVLFENLQGLTYAISDTTGFSVGDTLFVDGNLNASCVSPCMPTSGCIAVTNLSLCPAADFVRGDCGANGAANIADAVFLLGTIFPNGPPNMPQCLKACDANDDGVLNIADAVALLGSLFGSPAIPLDGPLTCGQDPTPDMLACDAFASCP